MNEFEQPKAGPKGEIKEVYRTSEYKFAGSKFERAQRGPKGGGQGCPEYKIAGSKFERAQRGPKGGGQGCPE